MENLYRWVIAGNGLCTQASYPYTGKTGTCLSCNAAVFIKSFVNVPANDDTSLQLAVIQQPVAIALQAFSSGLRFYSSGVFTGPCTASPDHAMIVIGYGEDSNSSPGVTLKYWKLKNDWGSGWGEGGFVRILRDPTASSGAGVCGMYMVPSYPVQ